MERKIKTIYKIANDLCCQNNTYYNGFMFKGENYSLGWIKLSKFAMQKFHTTQQRAKIIKHYTSPKGDDVYCLTYCAIQPYHRKWKDVYLKNVNIEDYIENIDSMVNVSFDELSELPFDDMVEIINENHKVDCNETLPHQKDISMPVVILGWVVYLIVFCGAFLFKDFAIRLIIWVVNFIAFHVWRWAKTHNINL